MYIYRLSLIIKAVRAQASIALHKRCELDYMALLTSALQNQEMTRFPKRRSREALHKRGLAHINFSDELSMGM